MITALYKRFLQFIKNNVIQCSPYIIAAIISGGPFILIVLINYIGSYKNSPLTNNTNTDYLHSQHNAYCLQPAQSTIHKKGWSKLGTTTQKTSSSHRRNKSRKHNLLPYKSHAQSKKHLDHPDAKDILMTNNKSEHPINNKTTTSHQTSTPTSKPHFKFHTAPKPSCFYPNKSVVLNKKLCQQDEHSVKIQVVGNSHTLMYLSNGSLPQDVHNSFIFISQNIPRADDIYNYIIKTLPNYKKYIVYKEHTSPNPELTQGFNNALILDDYTNPMFNNLSKTQWIQTFFDIHDMHTNNRTKNNYYIYNESSLITNSEQNYDILLSEIIDTLKHDFVGTAQIYAIQNKSHPTLLIEIPLYKNVYFYTLPYIAPNTKHLMITITDINKAAIFSITLTKTK